MRSVSSISCCAGLIAAYALGCSEGARVPAAHAGTEQASEGDPAAAPSVMALPSLPASGRADTPRTHQALLLAREAFDTKLAEPPPEHSFAELKRWSETVVVAWIEQRRAKTQATAERFALEGPPNAEEQIVSDALSALLNEDTARVLATLPAPSELDGEPEIAAMYRDIMRAQAESFVSVALAELRKCAEHADVDAEMAPFARFCAARFERLRAPRVAHAQSGTVASNARQ